MGRSTTSSPYKTMTRGQSGRSSTASGVQPPRDGSRHYAGWHVLREPRAHPRRSRSSTRLSSTEAPCLSPRAVPHVSLVRVDGEALGPSSSSTPTHERTLIEHEDALLRVVDVSRLGTRTRSSSPCSSSSNLNRTPHASTFGVC